MSNLKDVIEMNKGFFYYMNEANQTKYKELFGDYDTGIDTYFYFLYGFRPASNILAQNTLISVGNILMFRYYDKWKKLHDTLLTSLSLEAGETTTNKETYTGNGSNSRTNSDTTKVYGFDSEDGKTDSTTDTTNSGTNQNTYTKENTISKTNAKDTIENIKNEVSILTNYDFLIMVINDILTTVSQQVYNEIEE